MNPGARSMKKVEIETVPNEPHEMGVNSIRRYVSEALGTEHLAFVFYELEPGEKLSGGLHTHYDQEEVFYVLEGRVTFEYTRDREEVVVEAGEAIRFPSGKFQHGRNRSDDRVVAIALGAPVPAHSAGETEWFTRCEACEEETLHGIRSHGGGTIVSYCTECGNEFSS